jgi:hypothetical protein
LLKIENTTQAQTEQILAEELSLPVITFEKRTVHHDGSVTLTITFSKEQMALLEKVQDLMSHQVPEKKWADVVTLLAQREVDRKTKILRPSKIGKVNAKGDVNERVKATERVNLNAQAKRNELVNLTAEVKTEDESVTGAETDAKKGPKKEVDTKAHPNLTTGNVRKAIRPNLRKAIFNQQKGCAYTDPATGKICASTRFSQIDHRQSLWAGGQNEPENLQVLCSQHNRLKYRKEVGLHP